MADRDDEDRRNAAALLIQIRWREYLARTRTSPDADADQQGERMLTEEEQREQLLTRIRGLMTERETVIQQNLSQQWQLVRVMADRRAVQNDAAGDLASGGALAADVEVKYWDTIARIRADRTSMETRKSDADRDLHDARGRNESVLNEALECENRLRMHVRDMATKASFLRNTKPIQPKIVEEWAAQDIHIQSQVHEVRVTYLKLRNRHNRLMQSLKQKEDVNNGHHMIDFEQLKIENTNLNEKIEERNEDLLKLRKKATTTIHILTHVKEKLEFVKAENVQLHQQVQQQESLLTVLRDRLANAKKERDVFVNENLRMKEKMPMIGAEDLLLDYELRKKELETLRIEIVTLTNKHHELLQWITAHQGQLEKLHHTASAAGVTV